MEFPRFVRSIFHTRQELVRYLNDAMPGRAPAVPPIDFARRSAILIAVGPRSSTGYRLQIVSVHEQPHHIAVVAREQTPSLGEPVQARVTYPFRLITVPRTNKALFLHLEGRP